MDQVNEAAASLARARWSKTSKAERKEVGAMLAEARRKKIPGTKRRAIASKAGKAGAKARWGKR